MTEANLTTYFHKFLKNHPRQDTECYEFKMCKGGSFNYKQVHDHQVVGLMASLDGLWHKIADSTAMNGFTAKKPFDAIYIKAKRAYVVPIFYKERGYKEAILIPIKHFVSLVKTGKKSIKREDLEKLNFETFYL